MGRPNTDVAVQALVPKIRTRGGVGDHVPGGFGERRGIAALDRSFAGESLVARLGRQDAGSTVIEFFDPGAANPRLHLRGQWTEAQGELLEICAAFEGSTS